MYLDSDPNVLLTLNKIFNMIMTKVVDMFVI